MLGDIMEKHEVNTKAEANFEALRDRLARLDGGSHGRGAVYVDELRRIRPAPSEGRYALKRWVQANLGAEVHTLQVQPDGRVWAPGVRKLRQVRSGDFQLDSSWSDLGGAYVVGWSDEAVTFYDRDFGTVTLLARVEEFTRVEEACAAWQLEAA